MREMASHHRARAHRRATMKKLIIGGIAALIATASMATAANAGVVVKYKSGWRKPAAVVVVKPRVRV